MCPQESLFLNYEKFATQPYLLAVAFTGYQLYTEARMLYANIRQCIYQVDVVLNRVPSELEPLFLQYIENIRDFKALPTQAEVERAEQMQLLQNIITAIRTHGMWQQPDATENPMGAATMAMDRNV